MSFDATGREPEQAFRLNRDPTAELEYPTKWDMNIYTSWFNFNVVKSVQAAIKLLLWLEYGLIMFNTLSYLVIEFNCKM